MPLPAGIATVTVIAYGLLDSQGAPARGTVRFTPSVATLHVGVNVEKLPSRFDIPLVAGGFTAVLPATDDPGSNPVGWTYRVEERVSGGRTFSMALPSTPATQNYTNLVPVPSNTGTPVVVGPQGAPGYDLLMVDNGNGTYTLTTGTVGVLVDNGNGTFTINMGV